MMSNSKIASLHLTNRDIIWLAKSNFIILNSRKRFSIIFFMLLKTSDDDDHNFHSDNLFSSDCSFSFSVIHMILDLFAFSLIAETTFSFFIACLLLCLDAIDLMICVRLEVSLSERNCFRFHSLSRSLTLFRSRFHFKSSLTTLIDHEYYDRSRLYE